MSISLAIFNALNSLVPPRPFFGLRRSFLNAAGVTVGERTRISNCVKVYDRFVEIGRDSWIGPEVTFFSTSNGTIRIGSRVDVAPGCKFFAGTHELGSSERRAGAGSGSDISVGDGCWIGGASTILPGAQIGPGSVVAAGSVVRSGIYPGNVLLAGCPARVVKTYESSGDRELHELKRVEAK